MNKYNTVGVDVDGMKILKEVKYESWKRKNTMYLDEIFFIFKRWFKDILDLTEKQWEDEETKEKFFKFIYKRRK